MNTVTTSITEYQEADGEEELKETTITTSKI